MLRRDFLWLHLFPQQCHPQNLVTEIFLIIPRTFGSKLVCCQHRVCILFLTCVGSAVNYVACPPGRLQFIRLQSGASGPKLVDVYVILLSDMLLITIERDDKYVITSHLLPSPPICVCVGGGSLSQNGARNRNLRYVLHPSLTNIPGAGCKIRLESRIKRF